MISEKLELLSMAEKYTVTKLTDGEYEVAQDDAELGAIINGQGMVKYYVTGVYNSGADWAEIEMDELMALKRFCELLTGGWWDK